MKRVNSIAILFIALLSISCTYKLEEFDVNVEEEESIDFTDFSLTLNGLADDILIYKRINLEYIVDIDFFDKLSSSGKFVIYIDDQEYTTFYASHEENADTLIIDFSPSRYQDGEYKLSIVGEWDFTSQSLAGMLDYQYQLLGEWDIIIDKTPEPVEITNFSIEAGELWVEWDAPALPNFDYYLICSDATGSEKCAMVNRNSSRGRYPYFLTGSGDIRVLTVTDESASSAGPFRSFELHEELVSLTPRDSSIYMTLRQPTLYGHVQSFHSTVFNLDTIDFQEEEFLIASDLFFGEQLNFNYSFRLGNDETGSQTTTYESGQLSSAMGIPLPSFHFITYSDVLDSYFAKATKQGNTVIYKMDGSLNVVDTLMINRTDYEYAPMTISPSGDRLVMILDDQLYKINPISLQVVEELNLFNEYGHELDVSRRGRYGAKITTSDVLFLRISDQVAIDLNTNELIFYGYRNGGLFGQNGDISDDGKYIFSDGDLYELVSGNYEFVAEIDSEYKSGFFISETLLFHFNSVNIEIIDVTSLSVTDSFVIEEIERTEYFGGLGEVEGAIRLNDNKDHLISYLSNQRLEVYDFEGVKINEYPVDLHSSFYYLNGHLFAGIGQAIQLDIP